MRRQRDARKVRPLDDQVAELAAALDRAPWLSPDELARVRRWQRAQGRLHALADAIADDHGQAGVSRVLDVWRRRAPAHCPDPWKSVT